MEQQQMTIQKIEEKLKDTAQLETATFGMGCFWGAGSAIWQLARGNPDTCRFCWRHNAKSVLPKNGGSYRNSGN